MKIYVSNLMKSFSQMFWALIAGRMFPRYATARADLNYMTLDERTFFSLSGTVCLRMKAEGITYTRFYLDDAFDCVEFADCFCNYFAQAVIHEGQGIPGFGVPVRPMGFIEKKRGGHACIAVKIDGELEYYEPYPEHFRKLDLDKEEIASMRPIGF